MVGTLLSISKIILELLAFPAASVTTIAGSEFSAVFVDPIVISKYSLLYAAIVKRSPGPVPPIVTVGLPLTVKPAFPLILTVCPDLAILPVAFVPVTTGAVPSTAKF